MLEDYLKAIAEKRAKKMKERQEKEAQKQTWKLAPEDFQEPMGVYAFVKKKRIEDDEEDE